MLGIYTLFWPEGDNVTNDEQQRAALRALLEEGEQVVPPTLARIQEAVRKEAQAQETLPMAASSRRTLIDLRGEGQRERRYAARSHNQRRAIIWRNVAAAVMAAVVILAALLIFSYRLLLNDNSTIGPGKTPTAHTTLVTAAPHQSPEASSSTTPTTSTTPAGPNALYGGWNSAMIAFPSGDSGPFTVKNYDYTNGFSQVLNATPLPASTQFDGVPSNGQDLLYQYTSSNHVYYARLLTPLANTGFFYELNAGNAGNAVWMDSRHVLINTKHLGVIEVDSLTGQEAPYLPNLVAYGLVAYHPGYLYYIDSNLLVNRITIATGATQKLTGRSMNPAVWISPDGSTLYWINAGPVGQPDIYATNLVSGTSQLLRSSGEPVGFAADNTLLIVRLLNGQFQIVKLGATPQQDQMIFANAAPNATSLCPATMATPHQMCDNFVAMAPYGHAVIVQGTDANGTYHLWSDDIVTGQQLALSAAHGNAAAAQLLGWDRLPLPER